jgi:pyridoxine 5-phosphate synthase
MSPSSTALSVNLNKVALLRNSRPIGIPDLRHAATLALAAGADGITVHPRPDGRHVRADDVPALAELLRAWPAAEFNIEGNPLHQLMDSVRLGRPHQCTFVPDAPGQSTSDHGWDLDRDGATLRPLIDEAHARARASACSSIRIRNRSRAPARSAPTGSSSTPSLMRARGPPATAPPAWRSIAPAPTRRSPGALASTPATTSTWTTWPRSSPRSPACSRSRSGTR